MNLSDSYATLAIGGNLTPPVSDIAGQNSLGRRLALTFPLAKAIWQEKLLFSAAAQTIDLALETGTASALGSRQVETATVTAAAGCTASGNLTCTLTSSVLAGSPLSIVVPLTTTAHTTAALIAAAIAAKLNATAVVAARYLATSVANKVVLTALRGWATDVTLNLAIPGALGVTAAAASNHTVAGSLGVVTSRPSGALGEDAYGIAIPTSEALHIGAILLSNVGAAGYLDVQGDDSVNLVPTLHPGMAFLLTCTDAGKNPWDSDTSPKLVASASGVDLEIVVICV